MKKIMFNDRYGLTDAVLSERKTQTRRFVSEKLLDVWTDYDDFCNSVAVGDIPCTRQYYDEAKFFLDNSPYKIGEVIAIAQSYKNAGINFLHEEDEEFGCHDFPARQTQGWSNKMFVRADLMPHRIRINNIRVERLQDISDEDCIKEFGLERVQVELGLGKFQVRWEYLMQWEDGLGRAKKYSHEKPKEVFAIMIDKICGKYTWASNPWVFVYDFEHIENK